MGSDVGESGRVDGVGDEARSTQPLGDIDVRSSRIEFTSDIFCDKSLDEKLGTARDLAVKLLLRIP